MKLPRIGIVQGDPCGIGPELVAKLLTSDDVLDRARIVVIGDRRVLALGEQEAGVQVVISSILEELSESALAGNNPVLINKPLLDPESLIPGRVSQVAGTWQLDCLSLALELCRNGRIDGFCFAPLNKEALHLAGMEHEDEQGFFADELAHKGPLGILNSVGSLWTSRVTSHVALSEVSRLITRKGVLEAIRLADTTLRTAGCETPRLAVAGLNPHAGDGGLFGNEEKDQIVPAIREARDEGLSVDGPFPPDTVFLKAREGTYDAVVSMYHDQGQIAMKLMGFDQGVTVHAGLPFPVTTSAHGSAFDIAGKGVASVNALKEAFKLACAMAGFSKTTS